MVDHIVAQGAPGSLIRRFQEQPDLAVALLAAFRRTLWDSRDRLVDMEEGAKYGDYSAEDLAAKRQQVEQDEALLRRIEELSGCDLLP